jgi:uncharacterized protein (DUF433 family)
MKQEPRMSRVVVSFEEVVENIHTYAAHVGEGLAGRIKQHPAWYAIRDGDGNWLFGPSKFIGYPKANPQSYLSSYSRNDGKETEPALAQWFEQVDLQTALGRELRSAFTRFAEKFGKAPNSRWRVSVPIAMLDDIRGKNRVRGIDDRIAFDAEICGGRPHIRGTRIRVSDIVAALSEGESVEELLNDFPYLTREDVLASLQYAATAVDHRILVAA